MLQYAEDVREADVVLALRSSLKEAGGLKAAARDAGIPIYALKTASTTNLVKALRAIVGGEPVAGTSLREPRKAAAVAASASMLAQEEEEGVVEEDAAPQIDQEGTQRRILRTDEDLLQQMESPGSWAGGFGPSSSIAGGETLDAVREAIRECQYAMENLVARGQPAELLPRSKALLKIQRELVEHYGLACTVLGPDGKEWLR